MNCKEGDLAVVVQSNMGNLGKIVKCERIMAVGDPFLSTEGEVAKLTPEILNSSGPIWEISGNCLNGSFGYIDGGETPSI